MLIFAVPSEPPKQVVDVVVVLSIEKVEQLTKYSEEIVGTSNWEITLPRLSTSLVVQVAV